jgi:hypothetical protein
MFTHPEKTIGWLNAKTWWRAVKVAYFLLLILIVGGICAVIYDQDDASFNSEKSYIECSDGRKLALRTNGIYLYSDYVNYSDDQDIRKMCASGEFGRSVDKNYKLVAIYDPAQWGVIVKVWFLTIGSAALITEFLRRIFYYIILGSFTPYP